MPLFIHVETTRSTNSFMAYAADTLPDHTVLYTYDQTAGRGQRGNTWLCPPGLNIAMSIVRKDLSIHAREQFIISEVSAVGTANALSELTGAQIQVKWPNDIYWNERKLGGMLIENSLEGTHIARCIVGIGINVNQTEFDPSLPNPVSLKQITGDDYDLEGVVRSIGEHVEALGCQIDDPEFCKTLHQRYLELLFRNDGQLHTFAMADGTRFQARIVDVAPDGVLTLSNDRGDEQHFAFKQVSHVIDSKVL